MLTWIFALYYRFNLAILCRDVASHSRTIRFECLRANPDHYTDSRFSSSRHFLLPGTDKCCICNLAHASTPHRLGIQSCCRNPGDLQPCDIHPWILENKCHGRKFGSLQLMNNLFFTEIYESLEIATVRLRKFCLSLTVIPEEFCCRNSCPR